MNHNRTFSSLILLSTLAALAGCSGQEPTMVSPSVNLIDKSQQALSSGNMLAVWGTYTTCAGQTDGTSWSQVTSNGDPTNTTQTGSNPALSVEQDDTNCALALTDIVALSGMSDVDYTGAAPISLGTTYPTSGTAFSNSGTVGFYANADLTFPGAKYHASFTMNVVFSDNLATVSNSSVAASTTDVTASSVSETMGNAPDYTADASAISVGMDSGDLVTSASGNLVLSEGSPVYDGDFYVITTASVDTTSFDAVNSAYAAGTKVSITGGAAVDIAATALISNGTDLSTTSAVTTVIVHRANSGVSSYQTFTVTFSN